MRRCRPIRCVRRFLVLSVLVGLAGMTGAARTPAPQGSPPPATTQTGATQPAPTFRVDTDLVVVDLVATDPQSTPQEAMPRTIEAISSMVSEQIPDGTQLMLATVWRGLEIRQAFTTDRQRDDVSEAHGARVHGERWAPSLRHQPAGVFARRGWEARGREGTLLEGCLAEAAPGPTRGAADQRQHRDPDEGEGPGKRDLHPRGDGASQRGPAGDDDDRSRRAVARAPYLASIVAFSTRTAYV